MTEHDHQVALFDWCDLMRWKHPELELLFAIPNGGHRNKATAARLKAEGVRAGVPDICLPVARKCFHSMFIELKRPKTGRVSETQSEWHVKLQAAGNLVEVCQGWEAASEVLKWYLS